MIEMNAADSLSRDLQTAQLARVARRSAKILKIVAVVLAIGAFLNGWIYAATDQDQFYYGGGPSPDFPLWWKLQQFLSTALPGLGFAALVLAAGFAIEIVALRATRPPEPAAELSEFTPTPTPASETTNFAARPAQAPAQVALTPTAPPPMKIANDEIWRR